jgi:hypothetical protein
MNKENYKDFALFDYIQEPSSNDEFKLGDVVIGTDDETLNEIGVIIQCHGNNEYRTDMFGNCCYSKNPTYSNIKKATITNVLMNRASLLD